VSLADGAGSSPRKWPSRSTLKARADVAEGTTMT